MKKTYIIPQAEQIDLHPEGHILASSSLSGDGGSSEELLPGQGGHDGAFHAPSRGWNSDDWSGTNEEE